MTNSWLKRNYDKRFRRPRRNPLVQVRQLYNGYFGVEKGKYYLWRMYIFEFIENWIQFFESALHILEEGRRRLHRAKTCP